MLSGKLFELNVFVQKLIKFLLDFLFSFFLSSLNSQQSSLGSLIYPFNSSLICPSVFHIKVFRILFSFLLLFLYESKCTCKRELEFFSHKTFLSNVSEIEFALSWNLNIFRQLLNSPTGKARAFGTIGLKFESRPDIVSFSI